MLILAVLGSLVVLGDFVLIWDLVKCAISTVSTIPMVPTNSLGLAGGAIFDSVSLCTCTCFMISASVRISSCTVHILMLVVWVVTGLSCESGFSCSWFIDSLFVMFWVRFSCSIGSDITSGLLSLFIWSCPVLSMSFSLISGVLVSILDSLLTISSSSWFFPRESLDFRLLVV